MTEALYVPALARAAWAKWLSSGRWDVFVTLTDPGYPHPETMVKRCRYLEAKVNDSLYGRSWKRKGRGIETVTGLERQRRGSVHTHAIWRLPDHDASDPVQFSLRHWQRFASELGGFAWLQRPRSSADVVAYVSKYVVKDGELVLSPRLNPWVPRMFDDTLLAGTTGRA
jgi:hypothetical protein